MKSIVVLALSSSFLGCGANCPSPQTDPRTSNENVGHSQYSIRTSGVALASPDSFEGRWLVAEPGDEPEFVVELSAAGSGFAYDASSFGSPHAGQRERMPVELSQAAGEPPTLIIRDPQGLESVIWVADGPGRAILFRPNEDDLLIAYRTVPVPTEVQGDWVVHDEGRSNGVMQLSLTIDGARTTQQGETRAGPAFGLDGSPTGDRYDLAIGESRGEGRVRIRIVSMRAVGDGSYVLFEIGEDDILIAHRPGNTPAWLSRVARPPEREYPPPPG